MPILEHPLSHPYSWHIPSAPWGCDPQPNPLAGGDPSPCSLPSPPSQKLDQAQPHGQQDPSAWCSSCSSPFTRSALIKALG